MRDLLYSWLLGDFLAAGVGRPLSYFYRRVKEVLPMTTQKNPGVVTSILFLVPHKGERKRGKASALRPSDGHHLFLNSVSSNSNLLPAEAAHAFTLWSPHWVSWGNSTSPHTRKELHRCVWLNYTGQKVMGFARGTQGFSRELGALFCEEKMVSDLINWPLPP